MERVGKFEKVSFEQFFDAIKSDFYSDADSSELDEHIRDLYDAIQLPKRATSGSAGYDLRSPVPLELAPGDSVKIPTGVRALIHEGWWLGCFPRSGLGFKFKARLANTVGVIDADYAGSKNEGHIFIKLCNEGDKTITVNQGDAVIQAVFLPFGITVDDDATGVRDGGFGSTGR